MISFIVTMSDPLALERLAARLDAGRLRRGEPLAPYTTFKIGGPADLFYEPISADALASAVLAARDAGVPYFVLGLGANVLIGDRGVRGLVIRNTARAHEFRATGETCLLWTESGAIVKDLIQESVARGWSGLEHYAGIPSTVGGAIWQNLHFLSPAPARERTMFIAEVTVEAELMDEAGAIRTAGVEELAFGYDTSILHHRPDTVLSVTFELAPGDPERLRQVVRENLAW